MDEVREGYAAQFVEVPSEHVVPRRIHLDEFAVAAEDGQEIGRTVEEVPNIRDRRLVVLHELLTPCRADFQK